MRSLACVLITCVTVGPIMSAGQAQSPTFRAAAEGVIVEVSVQSGSRPVTNLQMADFEVFDKGVPQTVVEMTYGKLPIDVTVALVVSFCVSGTVLGRLLAAAWWVRVCSTLMVCSLLAGILDSRRGLLRINSDRHAGCRECPQGVSRP